MTDIKYRAWDKERKQMLKVHSLHLGTKKVIVTGICFGGNRSLKFSEVELMKYVGLADKNSKEAYGKDIITCEEYPFQENGEYNYHGIIEWDERLTSYYVVLKLVNPKKHGISDGMGDLLQNYDMSEMEIIGNAYENPELLEGAKK